jgi:hypothetical protein
MDNDGVSGNRKRKKYEEFQRTSQGPLQMEVHRPVESRRMLCALGSIYQICKVHSGHIHSCKDTSGLTVVITCRVRGSSGGGGLYCLFSVNWLGSGRSSRGWWWDVDARGSSRVGSPSRLRCCWGRRWGLRRWLGPGSAITVKEPIHVEYTSRNRRKEREKAFAHVEVPIAASTSRAL